MKYKLQDLIDMGHFQHLQDRLNEIYSFPSAIIDNEGNILTATAWQEICTKFHRKNEECEKACIQSDRYILSHLHEANPAVSYRCPHGLVDNATPIVIDGIHYGNFFTGQFFMDAPDLEFFKAQAKKYGFDEDVYLAAVKKVPIWSQVQLNNYLFFIKGLITIIAESGLRSLREIETKKSIEESDERTRTILQKMLDGFWITNTEGGRIVEVNDAMCRMTGYGRDELLKMSAKDVESNDSPDVVLQRAQKAIQAGSSYYETRFRRKDGSILDVEVSVTYLPKLKLFYSFHRDITQRKTAEADLKKTLYLLSSISENSTDAIYVKDIEGRYLLFNKEAAKFTRKKQEEVLGRDDRFLFPDKEAEAVMDGDRNVMKRRQVMTYEEVVTTVEGATTFLSNKGPVYDEKGEVVGLFGITRNITSRKRFEKVLDTRLKLNEFSFTHSMNELLQRCLDAAENLTESVIGFFHFVEPDQKILSLQMWSTNTIEHQCCAEGKGSHYPISEAGVWVDCIKTRQPVIRNDYNNLPNRKGLPEGHAALIRELVVPVLREGKIVALLGVGNKENAYTNEDVRIVSDIGDMAWDIVLRKRVEEALRDSEEKYRSMMEAMKDAAYICSPACRIEYMNPRMAGRIGGEAIGELCHKAIYGTDEKCTWCVFDRIRNGEHVEYELFNPKDNRHYTIMNSPIYHSSGDISKLSIVHDITEKKAIEEQLRQSLKMESIGTLAGGIAHDFNNILYIIIGNVELALEDTPEWAPVHTNLEEIKSAALRGSGIVGQLLNYARKTEQEMRPLDAAATIKDALIFLRSSIPTTIEMQVRIPDSEIAILADSTQISQLIMNLCANAFHAMEETGGTLTVALESTTVGNGAASDGTALPSGEYVKITIGDTGTGIEPGIIDRIFDPYFTTKAVGKGSGMGLAVVLGIVKNHGGSISVESLPGEGTVFTILLPVVDDKPAAETQVSEEAPRGTESILLIDDEDAILNMNKKVLEALGYTVEIKNDPVEALTLFQSAPDRFDLVITDMTMPKMTGAELSKKLRNIRFDIPMIICTGYSSLIDEKKAKEFGIDAFVVKPVVCGDMARTIRQVLEKKQSLPHA